jgi:hypothetical protein
MSRRMEESSVCLRLEISCVRLPLPENAYDESASNPDMCGYVLEWRSLFDFRWPPAFTGVRLAPYALRSTESACWCFFWGQVVDGGSRPAVCATRSCHNFSPSWILRWRIVFSFLFVLPHFPGDRSDLLLCFAF